VTHDWDVTSAEQPKDTATRVDYGVRLANRDGRTNRLRWGPVHYLLVVRGRRRRALLREVLRACWPTSDDGRIRDKLLLRGVCDDFDVDQRGLRTRGGDRRRHREWRTPTGTSL